MQRVLTDDDQLVVEGRHGSYLAVQPRITKLSIFKGKQFIPTENNVSLPSYKTHKNSELCGSWYKFQPVIGEYRVVKPLMVTSSVPLFSLLP